MKWKNITAPLAALTLSATAVYAVEAGKLVDAAKLDGTEVYDFHGTKLGDIQQILIDPNAGRIRYGVLQVDKSWNWNDPEVAVPWGSFVVKRGGDNSVKLSLDANKEKLEKAPRFKSGDADRLYGRDASQPIYTYWSIIWMDDPQRSDSTTGQDRNSSGATSAQPGSSGKASSASGSSVNPGGTNANPGGSSVNPGGANPRPGGASTNPGGSSTNPGSNAPTSPAPGTPTAR